MNSIVIEETHSGFIIKQYDLDSENSYPWTTKKTAKEVVARVAQLLEVTEAVDPQDWPESVQIG